jgi:DNA-binding CsgD family transcriptional regulator
MKEQKVAEQIIAGYTDKESANNLGLTVVEVRNTKGDVRQKAIQHLV